MAEEPTNWDRADRAATALQIHYDAVQGCDPFMGESYGDEGSGAFCEAFKDLLTDLMHLARRADENFDALLDSARFNFDMEEEEDDDD